MNNQGVKYAPHGRTFSNENKLLINVAQRVNVKIIMLNKNIDTKEYVAYDSI